MVALDDNMYHLHGDHNKAEDDQQDEVSHLRNAIDSLRERVQSLEDQL